MSPSSGERSAPPSMPPACAAISRTPDASYSTAAVIALPAAARVYLLKLNASHGRRRLPHCVYGKVAQCRDCSGAVDPSLSLGLVNNGRSGFSAWESEPQRRGWTRVPCPTTCLLPPSSTNSGRRLQLAFCCSQAQGAGWSRGGRGSGGSGVGATPPSGSAATPPTPSLWRLL